MSRNTIELILSGTDQNVSSMLDRVTSGLGGLGQVASNALGVLAGNLATAAIQQVTDLGRALADDLVNEAPRLEQVATSFENLAESAGQSADVVLASMRDAANGMVSDAELMESYNQALLLVGESMADQFPALLEIAQASAAATGEEVGFMLDSLVTGIGRASPQILDNLGLTISVSEAYEQYASTLGIAADEMSRAQQQEALLNAVVAQGGDFVERLGDNTGGAAATIGQMRTSLQNLKDGALQALLPALQALLEPLAGLAEDYGPVVLSWAAEFGETLGSLIDYFVFAAEEGDALNDFLANLPEGLQPIAQAIGEVLAGGGLESLIPDAVLENVDAFTAGLQPVLTTIRDEIWPAIVEFLPTLQLWGEQLLELASNALPLLAQALQFVVDNWQIFAVIGGVVAAVVLAIEAPIVAVIAALAALYLAWQNDWGGIRTTLTEFWEGSLQPALQQIAAWLQERLPVAIATLSAFWTERLQPAIQAVVGFFQGSVMPVLSTVANVASAVLGAAIATLAAVWENVLQPALATVWGFFQNSVIPIINAVADVASAVLEVAITALAGVWQNVLQPALEAVWGVISDSVIPVFEEIAGFVEDNVGPALERFANTVLPPIQGAFEGISDAISGVVDWLGDLADRIRNLELPDWLTPGSPTPFETGLRGIADAMGELTRVNLPQFGQGLQAGGLGAPAGAGGSGVTFQGCTFILQDVDDADSLLQQLQDLAE